MSSQGFFENGMDHPAEALNTEIAERKKTEQQLRESEILLRQITDNMQDIIVQADLQGNILYVSPSIGSILGYDPKEMLGKTIFEQVHAGDLAQTQVRFREGVEKVWPGAIEFRFRHADEHYVWLECVGNFLFDGTGSPTGIIICARDISARKAAEEVILKARDELEIRIQERTGELKRSNEALRAEIREHRQAEAALIEMKQQAELYVDLMGHDINNLNQIAMGFLEIAQDTLDLPEEKRELITKPLEALKNSSQLIDNVRKLQRARTGRSSLHTVDLSKVIGEVHTEYSHLFDHQATISYRPVEGARVMADDLLRDVFSNLIGNAVKHSQGFSVIEIRLTGQNPGEKTFYRISVEDDGPGVPDEYKKVIFNRLERGKTGSPGSGLGLHLVKTLVDEYGGTVWVEDRVPGDHSQGSRFVVMLPAADP